MSRESDLSAVAISAPRRSLRLPLLLYSTLACAATWPLVTVGGQALAGDVRADAWKHAWGFWWFFEAAKSGSPFPTRTALLGFPGGGSMYNIDPLNSLLSVPLQAMLSLPAAFNLLLLMNLVAGATAAWALARAVSGDEMCALPAGVVYAFSPFILSYALASGVTETTSLVWLPLFLLALIRLPQRGLAHAAGTGALLGLTAFSCWYYGIFALIWTVLWAFAQGVLLIGDARDVERRTRLRAFALRLGIVAIITADIVVAPLVAFWMSLTNPDALHPASFKRTPEVASAYLDPHNSVALRDFVSTGKGNPVVSHISDRLTRTAYVGFFVVVLGAIAVLRDPRARFWLASVLLFGGLSLGPTFLTAHDGVPGPPNPLYAAFYNAFPGFTQVAIPYRCCVPMMLAFGVLTALGLRHLSMRAALIGAATHRYVALGASALVLADFIVTSPAPWPLPMLRPPAPETLSSLAQTAPSRGVLDLPCDWVTDEDTLLPGEYFYAQTLHHRPIPYKVSGHMPAVVEGHPVVATVRALTLPALACAQPPDENVLRDAADSLARLGFGAVILHRTYLSDDRREAVQAMLDASLGTPIVSGENRIYVLPAAALPTP